MITLLNFFISLLIPYTLVAMFCVLSMVDNFINSYKNVVQSSSFIVVMVLYSIVSLIVCAAVDVDNQSDFIFIKKIKK